MFQLLLLTGVVLGGYVVLTQTLFRRSRCKGNAPMAGKTVIITGESVSWRGGVCLIRRNEVWKCETSWGHSSASVRIQFTLK